MGKSINGGTFCLMFTKSSAGIPLFIFLTLNHFKRNLVYKSFQFVQLWSTPLFSVLSGAEWRKVHFNISSFHGIWKEREVWNPYCVP
jgi:hypothetical protein